MIFALVLRMSETVCIEYEKLYSLVFNFSYVTQQNSLNYIAIGSLRLQWPHSKMMAVKIRMKCPSEVTRNPVRVRPNPAMACI
jgi:hypothetical protein